MQAPYTVVISDVRNHDTGMRGTDLYWRLAARYGVYAELGLYWFLCEHFERSAVRLTRPSRLLRESSPLATDWLFFGLPTTLNKQHLSRIKCRRMVVYDSTDYDRIEFGDSDQHFLASNTNICLKNWRERKWDFDISKRFTPGRLLFPATSQSIRVLDLFSS